MRIFFYIKEGKKYEFDRNVNFVFTTQNIAKIFFFLKQNHFETIKLKSYFGFPYNKVTMIILIKDLKVSKLRLVGENG